MISVIMKTNPNVVQWQGSHQVCMHSIYPVTLLDAARHFGLVRHYNQQIPGCAQST
jgi:hypothetical protein